MLRFMPAIVATTLLAAVSPQTLPASADGRVDALLAAMGGRDAWARTTFVYVRATHHDLVSGAPFGNEIWNDFSAPRVRIEAVVDGQARTRGFNGASGWRVREGSPSPLTAEQLAADHAWWESNVYRTLHRLARRDKTLTIRAAGTDRIEVYRPDGRRLNWLQLNPRGEPVRFGTWDSEAGSVFGPLVEASGGLKHWRWGTSADGSFRFEIAELRGHPSVPPGVSFEKPRTPESVA